MIYIYYPFDEFVILILALFFAFVKNYFQFL
jgi:hypothetical protein